jgi:hypothetical protein
LGRSSRQERALSAARVAALGQNRPRRRGDAGRVPMRPGSPRPSPDAGPAPHRAKRSAAYAESLRPLPNQGRGGQVRRFVRPRSECRQWVIHLTQVPSRLVGPDGCGPRRPPGSGAVCAVASRPAPLGVGPRIPSPCQVQPIHSAHARTMLDLIEMDNPLSPNHSSASPLRSG